MLSRAIRYVGTNAARAAKPARKIKSTDARTTSLLDPILSESLVLYKDDDMVALDKPSGLPVHGGPKVADDLCSHLHRWQYDSQHPPNLVHRLDRDTSGVILLSRSSDAARRLARLFQERRVNKKYWAITVNVPPDVQGSVEIPLGTKDLATQNSPRHHMHRVVLRRDKVELYRKGLAGQTVQFGIQLAHTNYQVLSCYGKRCSLMELQTVTGFKHQVRVHLADGLLCPVVGDYKFGGPLFRAVPGLKRKLKSLNLVKTASFPMCLHAYEICIPDYHRDGVPLVIRAPPPASFCRVARQLMLKLPHPRKS